MKQIETVDITITSLINDLNTGLTWLEKDNIGYGSIQDKYNATAAQIMVISKHPKLVDVEPVKVFFALIDDTEQNNNSREEQVVTESTDKDLEPADSFQGL